MLYQINGLIAYSEEDSYQDGCLPGTGSDWTIDYTWTGKTADEVIQKVADFLNVETSGRDNGVERNACDEPGRVDFAKMEDAHGTTPSKKQIAAWHRGREKLYYVVYTGIVQKVETVNL